MKESVFYKFIRIIVVFFTKVVFRPKFVGINNIPSSSRVILAGNHTSYFDCLLLMCACSRNVHFLAKCELFKGVKGLLFSHLELIPVDRKNGGSSSFYLAKKYLMEDKVIGIFPEGTICKDGNLLPFKRGAVCMSYDCDSLIVPFCITGKFSFWSRPKIVFGKGYKVDSNDISLENDILREKILKLKE